MTIFQQQCLLAYLGYSPGAIDGISGANTQKAARAFLEANGLKPEALETGLLEAVGKRDFWNEIRHFTREEFRCKCAGKYCSGYPAQMREEAVRIADAAREHFGRPAHVVSGLRCPQWNRIQGGVENSQHMSGEAIDLRIDGVDAAALQRFVSGQPNHRYSYCINSTNVHFDIPRKGGNG